MVPTLRYFLCLVLFNTVSLHYKWWLYVISGQMVVSRKANKKQHVHASTGLRHHHSWLFIWMAALNFYNAVAQLVLQLSLSLLQTKHFLLSGTKSSRIGITIHKNHPVCKFWCSLLLLGPKFDLYVNYYLNKCSTNTFMPWWIILENNILMHLLILLI